MQIRDLVKPISEMTSEELLEKVRQMRHGREVAKPVAKAKEARAEKKATTKKASKAASLLLDLNEDALAAILKTYLK